MKLEVLMGKRKAADFPTELVAPAWIRKLRAERSS